MKHLICVLTISIIATVAVATAYAQKPKAGGLAPGRTMEAGKAAEGTPGTHADSVKFQTAFKELYSLIKPVPSVTERADLAFKQMSRGFKQQGIDSAKAFDSVMATVDKTEDERI